MTAFMKPGTSRALKKMHAMTSWQCANVCPSKTEMPATRCCDKMFCEISAVTMRELGGGEPKATKHPSLPYMGEQGCTIPPEFRPVCTGFVCQSRLKADPGFASRWENLHGIISADPNVRRAVEKSKRAIGGLEGAINRFRSEHPVEHRTMTFVSGDRCLVMLEGGSTEAAVVSDNGETVTVIIDGFEGSNSFPRERIMALTATGEKTECSPHQSSVAPLAGSERNNKAKD